MGSTSTIIAGVVAATGLTVLNDLLAGNLAMKPVIAGFVVGTFLLVIGLFNTPIAGALALLLLITSVFVNGVPVLRKVMPSS
jgi:hypothetical protein